MAGLLPMQIVIDVDVNLCYNASLQCRVDLQILPRTACKNAPAGFSFSA